MSLQNFISSKQAKRGQYWLLWTDVFIVVNSTGVAVQVVVDMVPKGLQLSYITLATIHVWLICYANDFYTLCPMLGISSLKPASFSIEKRLQIVI